MLNCSHKSIATVCEGKTLHESLLRKFDFRDSPLMKQVHPRLNILLLDLKFYGFFFFDHHRFFHEFPP